MYNSKRPLWILLMVDVQGWVSSEETYFFQDTWKKLEKTGRKWFIPEERGRNWNKVKETTGINVQNTVLFIFDINSVSNR